ncbi:MAG: choice-of-anchor B family protein [bacterium]|nr:choice-of-anchor B family protein [bacterium]
MKSLSRTTFISYCLLLLIAIPAVQGIPISILKDSVAMSQIKPGGRTESPVDATAMLGAAAPDSTFSLCLQSTITPDQNFGGTDCWGWEDVDGKEYAIMGVATGIVFVDAQTMQVKDLIPGPQTGCGSIRWRDIKNYGKYCYAVSECAGTNQGMMIMDMSFLPDSVRYIGSFSTVSDIRCHNISIDTAKGYAYLVKQNYSGFRIVRLTNPTAPVEIGTVVTGDCHDVFARNDTVWVAEGTMGSWAMYDLANKNSPQLITRVHVPNPGYVHNIWPTEDGKYAGTTEETASKTVKFWDIEDPLNVFLAGEYLAPSGLCHNVHMQSGMAFMSHYESGVAVVDMTDPSLADETALFDTYATSEAAQFNGAWGVFPHTRTGKVYASNLDGRLFVFLSRTEQLLDTLEVSSVSTNPGEQITVDISVENDVSAHGFVLPIDWTGPYGLSFDSASTFGLRTSYFEDFNYLGYDLANSRIAVEMKASSFGTSPDLPPGSGPVLRLYFTVPPGAAGDSNLVRLAPYAAPNTIYPSMMTQCFNLQVPLHAGNVTLGTGSGCCINRRGNANGSIGDGVDLSDLSTIISFLTVSGSGIVFPCGDEANVDGSVNGLVDLTDLSLMISYLTVTPQPVLPLCP